MNHMDLKAKLIIKRDEPIRFVWLMEFCCNIITIPANSFAGSLFLFIFEPFCLLLISGFYNAFIFLHSINGNSNTVF